MPGHAVRPVIAEALDAADAHGLHHHVERHFGHADVLINNAGLFSPSGNISTVSPTNWWADFEINVKGTFLVTQGFLKLLGTERQGTIITMSTAIAYMAPPGLSAYSISKMASVRLSEYVSTEYKNVNAVSLQPGVVKTDMVTGMCQLFELVGYQLML